jgi:hypothetical protein
MFKRFKARWILRWYGYCPIHIEPRRLKGYCGACEQAKNKRSKDSLLAAMELLKETDGNVD